MIKATQNMIQNFMAGFQRATSSMAAAQSGIESMFAGMTPEEKTFLAGQLWGSATGTLIPGNPNLRPATMGKYHGWMHECGEVDWLLIGHAPADGGCDRCESGSDDASDWKQIYTIEGYLA